MKILIYDTEANGLKPDRFWVVVFKEFKGTRYDVFINDNYYSSSWHDLVDGNHYAFRPLSDLKGWFQNECNENSSLRCVGHNNIDFDNYWLKTVLGFDLSSFRVGVRDSYVLSRLAVPKRPGGHSVEAWGQKFGLVKQEIANEQWSTFDPIMVKRCIGDVDIQERIYEFLREKELRGYSVECIELEHAVQEAISQQRRDGIFIDEQKVSELYADTKRHADYLQRKIRDVFKPTFKLVREYKPRKNKDGQTWAGRSFGSEFDARDIGGDFSSIHLVPFNVDSPKQRLERLLKIGWKPVEKTPTGAPKLTEDSLNNLPPDAPKEAFLIGEYLMSRSRQRLAEQLLEGRDARGYIHGYVDIIGANTHRMASNSPNLQNIPTPVMNKDGTPVTGLKGVWGWECRDVFTVENALENCLVDADASGIQLRGLAHYGNDPEYIRLVSDPNVDIHTVHADVLECSRSVSKTFIYAFLMGAGAKKLILVLGGTDEEKGRDLLKNFYVRFPFLEDFKKRLDKEVERGYTCAIDGRLIRLDREAPHKAMSVALQSFEAIIMKKGLTLYQSKLKKEGIPFIQRLMVHDEYLSETRNEFGEIVGKAMVEGIVKAGEILNIKCPLDGKYRIGKTWSEVH